MSALPNYVVINNPECPNKKILRVEAELVSFPLSLEDQKVIELLTAKYESEETIAGLAAPQIGFSKKIIIFAVPDDPNLRKWRPDIVETMPRTVWINASYEPIGEEKVEAYEGCFSVENLAGPVARYKSIRYEAYTPEGKRVTGIANGYLARVIQHEIDHTLGVLFIDKVNPDKLLTMAEYRQMRARAIEQ